MSLALQVFYDASKDSSEYRFGDSIRALTQTDKEALVEFESGRKEAFDAVVLADGLGSRSRSLVFEPEAVTFESVGACTAYFSIPPLPPDAPWSQIWSTTQRRCMWLRPAPAAPPEPSTTLACLLVALDSSNQHLFTDHRSLTPEEQKQVWEKLYRGAGWQTDRVLDQMERAEDFHSVEMTQVKIEQWHRGRVVLVGDAAYCPSPLSGMGTSSAVTGAYVLGQELGKAASSLGRLEDVTKAFESYDSIVRPYVEQKQNEIIPPWVRRMIWPESALGVKTVQLAMSGLGWMMNREVVQRWAKRVQDEEDEGLAFVEGSDELNILHHPTSTSTSVSLHNIAHPQSRRTPSSPSSPSISLLRRTFAVLHLTTHA
ncbi:hypothetical protein BCR35DRAFT_329658 [Leucosporidium creatinivorum]|uniref:FAD-binding domain-containing protein n=1 Tax=Leucosporidium creatinivorum TaxID=106004 RepID=A0A1Y2FZV5_9BASI|nr:hypothetical protein BCR35DRAFT_329658 [Leucosporidium creatinivorum]